MNRSFMLLNDNTIEITNEYEQEINRGEFENNNVKGILLAENKTEITECFKRGFNIALLENEKVLKMSSSMLKFQVILFAGLPLFGFLYGAITNPSTWIIHAISESIYAFAGSIIPIATATIYWSIIRPKYKRRIREIESLINKTEDIKRISEEELLKEKNKTTTITLEPLVRISLEEETNTIKTQITDELIYHHENTKQKVKTRIRKKYR